MQAILVVDEYSDLSLGYPYEISRVFGQDYICLNGSPRRYLSNCFTLTDGNTKLSHREAYRLFKEGKEV